MNDPKQVVMVCRNCGTDHEATIYWAVCEGDRCVFRCAICHGVTPHTVTRVGAMR